MPVRFDQVTYVYPGSHAAGDLALAGVTLEIADGEFLGVIGHTGSGKSTLIQHINGLLQPTSGRVTVDGLDLMDRSVRREVRRRVGLVFQYPEHQLFADTVSEDVAFGPRALGVPAQDIEQCVIAALERVGLDFCEVGHRSPFELSGGQMRRVAIAGVLATQPGTLVMDEPMAGLDPAGRSAMRDLLRALHQQGLTIVMVSHDMEDVAALADRVLVLRQGAVYAHGATAEVFSRHAELREIGLGAPRPARFAARLTSLGLDVPDDALTVEALADAIVRACADCGEVR
ncbi:MAG: energy-coupling factor transporter ATPase [Coriobacteriia bacterium]|nr:energy-coupling factor transporter ATPase [Coriobacteriia bacterium]